jgi:hypothetical protein
MTRTLHDWLEHARDSADAREAHRCLDAAIALARECYEWRAILAALDELPPLPSHRVAELADRTLVAADAARDPWGFRDVATLRVAALDDVTAARRALEAGVEAMRRSDAPGYAWSILADGFVETLDDRPASRRCLDEGCESARRRGQAPDLADLAQSVDRSGDRPAALRLVAEAQRIVEAGDPGQIGWVSDVSWVAIALHELADFTATTRLLNTATDRARTTGDAVYLAKSFDSHRDDRGTERALSRAAELATGADDWYAVAEGRRETRRGDAAVRDALDRAAAIVTDDAVRERIASGFLQWLGDGAAADRVGPRGAAPGARRTAVRAMPGWDAAPTPLFEWLRTHVTDESLRDIAEADYARDVDEHLAALLDIRDTGLVPQRLAWHPGEVVSLYRWRRGERVDHLGRAWCCVLLSFDEDEEVGNIVPGIVDSCLALGEPATDHAARLLAWVCETDSEPRYGDREQSAPPTEALYALLLLCAGRDPGDPRIDSLISMIMDAERDEPGHLNRLYGGSVIVDLWDDLTGRLLVPLRATRPDVDRLIDALGWPLE